MNRKRNQIKEGTTIGNIIIYAVMILVCFITLYPMYYALILSISDPLEAATMQVYFFPKGLYFRSYAVLVKDTAMWRAYGNTILYVVTGTAMMLLTSATCAYSLTSKKLLGRKIVVIYLLIPMYFSGGLIPSFLLVSQLGLYNTIWAIIIPGGFSIWHIILTRTYFASIPENLRESARIDGANNFSILARIYIPLAKPILAVVSIYTIVGIWNNWFSAMVYLPDLNLQPLQMYLRRVLVEQTVDLTKLSMAEAEAMARLKLSNSQLKYSMIIFTTLPVIFAYPFFQKYFVKGVMLGSLKG
ncbi:MAG: carbohydrate ABC transporter permease [Clostridiaceae bacterium]|nr:carbohydrate ABC transporter permease [Clostridiaceae bacterium]